MDFSNIQLPSPDELQEFLLELKGQGFAVDGDRIAACLRLLLDAHVADPRISAHRFGYRLAPVIVRSCDEQALFYLKYDNFVKNKSSSSHDVIFDIFRNIFSYGSHFVSYLWKVIIRQKRFSVSLFLVGAFILVASSSPQNWGLQQIIIDLYNAVLSIDRKIPLNGDNKIDNTSNKTGNSGSTSGAPETNLPLDDMSMDGNPYNRKILPVQETRIVTVYYYVYIKYFISLSSVILFVCWMVGRWLNRFVVFAPPTSGLADTRLSAGHEARTMPFRGQSLVDIARYLEDQPASRTMRIDVAKTVDATCRSAGAIALRFCDPCEDDAPVSYVFLIERLSIYDHICSLFEIAISELEKNRVDISRYYYRSDPRYLFNDDENMVGILIEDIAEKTQGRHMFVIGSGDGFVDYWTGEVERWVIQINRWRSRTLMSILPTEYWGKAEYGLRREGFAIVPANPTGFLDAARSLSVGTPCGTESTGRWP